MPYKRRKGKSGGGTKGTASAPPSESAAQRSTAPAAPVGPQLVLTSDKRRGVYECDYCHSDISQVPRIRCAICPDFDLCLDCFVTTDHAAASARLKAATNAHGAVQEGPTPGISAASVNHQPTHPYKVADSTRYPLFPSARVISKELQASDTLSTDGMDVDDDATKDSKTEETKKDEAKVETTDDTKNGTPTVDDKADDKADEAKKAGEAKKPIGRQESGETEDGSASQATNDGEIGFVMQDDPKTVWTVAEDLRLLDAISTCGLGSWADISEAISGHGSSSKTPKRCMERYFDDFLGRFGHILPAYTVVEDEEEQPDETNSDDGDGESEPKRRRVERMSSFGVASQAGGRRGKKKKVVQSGSLPGYEKMLPSPYLPPLPNIQVGQDVGRDQQYRAEQVYVKLITNAASKAEVDKIHKEWAETRLLQPNGPTALPMRTEDLTTIPGSELAGFMPRRGDFDMEWENDAENVIADMEFSPTDSAQDRELKIQVIQIYNAKLDERERRKQYLLSRGLLDYRKNQEADAKLPRDERDLVRRMRLFERFHTPQEHKQFIGDILKAKKLRKEIALLQMYRRIGIRSLAEAEQYENDKRRREIHKMSHLAAKEAEAEKQASAGRSPNAPLSSNVISVDDDDVHGSLWKSYRKNNRNSRRNRNSDDGDTPVKSDGNEKSKAASDGDEKKPAALDAASSQEKPEGEASAKDGKAAEDPPKATDGDKMDVDKPDEKPAAADTMAKKETDNADAKKSAEGNGDKSADMEIAASLPTKDGSKDSKREAVESKPAAAAEVEEGPFKIVGLKGYDLLTKKEANLCRTLKLKPTQYLNVKKTIIHESFKRGMLNKESSAARNIMTIDVEKKGNIIDFMVKAGWISTKIGV